MSIYIKHRDGLTTAITTEVSREETLAKIAAAIGERDWSYVEEQIAAYRTDQQYGWEAAKVYAPAGNLIAVIRLVPMAYGIDDRVERRIEVHLDGQDEPFVVAEAIEVPEVLR
jgi:hypothetical protein